MELTKKNCMIAKNRMRGLAYSSCNCKEENIDEVNNCDNYLEQLINEHFNNFSLNKTAKEMFEEVGMKCTLNNDIALIYGDENGIGIYFSKPYKSYTLSIPDELIEDFEDGGIKIDMKMHKAIYQQCRELGWVRDE